MSFARKSATDQRLLKRSCESLLGICSGFLADNHLSDNEIRFLDTWLKDNDDIATTWPGEVISARVEDILKDGVIEESEREYLKQTLSDLLGGTLENTGATGGTATRLPIDDIDLITIESSIFCFTGQFLYGTRKACESAITKRGGDIAKSVTRSLDYLVIGTMSTRSWVNTSHGRKIEKAVDYKKKGIPILIASEEQWVQFL